MAKKLKILTVITPKFFSLKSSYGVASKEKKFEKKKNFSKIFTIFSFENY